MLVLTGALVLDTAGPSVAHAKHVAARIAKVPADAHGYFYVPPNYVDDGYVYNPVTGRNHRHPAGGRSHHRHRNG